MSKRIRELAIQAKLCTPLILQYWGNIDALTDSEQEELQNVEKFAKLIIQECAEVAGCNGHVSGFTLGDLIKEHFGIKE